MSTNERSSSLHDLKQVIRETLERKGLLNSVTAQLRSEVFQALNDPDIQKPKMSNENVLVNELIREYLEFNHYKYTASVLRAESGQADMALDRSFLCSELNVQCTSHSEKVPLLYSLVNHFKEGRASSTSNELTHHKHYNAPPSISVKHTEHSSDEQTDEESN